MRKASFAAFVGVVAAVVVAAVRVEAADRISAARGFALLQETAAGDAEALRILYPSSLVERRPAQKQDEWRAAYHERLRGAAVLDVRERDDSARVRIRDAAGATAEVPLQHDRERWIVAAAQEQVTDGPALATANGDGPAKVALTTRTTNEAYGTTAFSFAHVTQKKDECLNRVDLWFCHNEDLHFAGKSRATLSKARSLDKVREVPLDADWEKIVSPKRGQVYVIHARRHDHRDFYVRARILAVGKKGCEIEWSLLSTGEGSPPSIHEPHPIQSNAGADGAAGMCAKE